MPAGAPTKYKTEFAQIAAKMCELGATDQDLADAFKVNVRSIYRWSSEHDEFCQSLKANKAIYDDKIERSLAMRALGYSHPDTDLRVLDGKIVETEITKHYPPDTTACIFWLKNRKPDKYRLNPDDNLNDETPSMDIRFDVKKQKAEIKITNAGS